MKKDMFTLEKQMVLEILMEKLKDREAAEKICELFEGISNSEKNKRCLKQKEGIKKARESGVALGRPKLKVPDNFEHILAEWDKGGIRAETAAKACGMGISTFYRRARNYLSEKRKEVVDNE